MENYEKSSEKMYFEEAMDKVGFGLYGVLLTVLTAMILFAFSCVGSGSMFLIPCSACELATTPGQQGLLAAGPIVGLSVGGIIWSYFAESRGRRVPLIMLLLAGAAFNIIGTVSINWVMLLVFQFLGTFCSSGLYSLSMSLLSESVPIANRSTVVVIVSSFMIISQGLMAVLAIPIIPLTFSYYLPGLGIHWNSWRLLMLVFSIPHLFSAIILTFMQESPKFVFIKGDESKAIEILQAIHRMNNWRLREELQVKCLLKDKSSAITDTTSATYRMSLFRKPLLKNIMIMLFLYAAQQFGVFWTWLPQIADQFVHMVQTGDNGNLTICHVFNEPRVASIDKPPCSLDESSLLIVLGIGVLETIFNSCVGFLIIFVGRRNMTIGIFLLSGVSGILVNVIPNIIASASLFVAMLMGGIVYGLCTSICVDLFLTNLRTLVIALSMTASSLSTVASIQMLRVVVSTHCDTWFYLYGSLLVLAAIVTSFLPNDFRPKKRKLQLVDAESLMEKNSKISVQDS